MVIGDDNTIADSSNPSLVDIVYDDQSKNTEVEVRQK